MDPWLEHPALWPDVHNSLIAAIRDALTPLVVPRYYIALERRCYLLKPDDLVLVGVPDVALAARSGRMPAADRQRERETDPISVLDVEVPMGDEVGENFLEIHEVTTRKLVTVLELLSPVNKLHLKGREDYTRKRDDIFRSQTSLVEIDLLRDGEPMPLVTKAARTDYRVLVSRGHHRPRATLYSFGLRSPMPSIPVPLSAGEPEPQLELGQVFHQLYTRARFDLRLDYAQDPVPSLGAEDQVWAKARIAERPLQE